MTGRLKQKCTSVIKGKKSKDDNKKRRNENFEKQKMLFLLISKGSLHPKIRFLGLKVCSVARVQTDRHTDTQESEYRGHPFRGSGFFSSIYYEGSVQQTTYFHRFSSEKLI